MRRTRTFSMLCGLCMASMWMLACSGNPTAPSGVGGSIAGVESGVSGGVASVRTALIPEGNVLNSCSDAPVRWFTQNYSPVDNRIRIEWYPVLNIGAYEIEMRHTHDEQRAAPRLFRTTQQEQTELAMYADEGTGRYFYRVRVLNRCDRAGEWSQTLTVYIDGGDDPKRSEDYPPYEPPGDGEEPCDDTDDGNNGHGNDCDRDDDSNPGGH